MRRSSLVLVLLGALASAAPAHALTRVASVGGTWPGVDLAGGRVVFAESPTFGAYRNDSDVLIRAAAPGRPPVLLAREQPRTDLLMDVAFAGGSRQVAIAREDYDQDDEGFENERLYTSRTLSGIALGGGQRWDRGHCEEGFGPGSELAVAASGDALASPLPGCRDDGLTVRRLSRRGAPAVRFANADPDEPFDVEGRWLAFRDRERNLFLTDWRGDRHPVARVASAASWSDVEVDGEGRVLVASLDRFGCGGELAIASPQAPELRELPVDDACLGAARIAGGRIAFLRRAAGGMELVSSDLAGGHVRPVARFGRENIGGFDFDGRRFAWIGVGCHRDSVYVTPVRPDRVAARLRDDCPLRIPRAALRLGPRGRVAVPVRCPIGCRVWGGSLTPALGPEVFAGPATIRPGTGRVVFELDPTTRRHLARRGSLKVEVHLTNLRPVTRDRDVKATLVLRR